MADKKISVLGLIDRILSYSERQGMIFVLLPLGNTYGDSIKVKINKKTASGCPVPCIGQIWEITGAYDKMTAYGEQIIADFAQIALPKGSSIVYFLTRNPAFAGIGVKTAKKLWALYGDELYEILSSRNVNKLIRKINLSETVITILFEKWNDYLESFLTIEFFNSIKLPAHLAWKARELWGNDLQERITEDPYRLLALSSWEQVDKCAREVFSIPKDSKLRYVAATESALYNAYDDKHTAQFHGALVDRLRYVLDEKDITPAINLALAEERVRSSVDANGSLMYRVDGAQVIEDYIEDRILEIENETTINFAESDLNNIEVSLPHKLTAAQRNAVKMVVEKPFAVVLGGRAVGKKTVLNCVFRILPRNAVIMQLMLTVQAAYGVCEVTGQRVLSVHEFLQLTKNSGLPENLYLFFHEASALDAATFYQILLVLPKGSRLYLIGDHYQLPPNGPGLILHQLVMDQYPHITTLTKVLGGPLINDIPIVADAIKSQRKVELEKFVSGQSKGLGVSFLSTDDKHLIDSLIYTYRELGAAGETQIVASEHETCRSLNAVLHYENISMREYEHLSLETIFGKDVELAVGDRIIYTGHTDRIRSLFNGSVGTITEIYKRPVIMESELNRSYVYVAEANFNTTGETRLTEEDLKHVDLGYCVILNESHFDRWECVVIAAQFAENHNDSINNNWFYTGVTRSKKQCVIVGSLENFNFQISVPSRSPTRCVGLNFKR
jgi:exodeoxyribonuclease V alpha subunit